MTNSIERYTIEQRVKVVQAYYENGLSNRNAYRALRKYFGQSNRPNVRSIGKIVQKFEKTGSVEDVKTPVRTRTARTAEKIAAVRDSVTKEPSTSTRRRAQQLHLSRSSLRNILHKDLHLHASKASGVTVSDVCKTTYEEIKKDKKHRYVIFYIRDEKQIDVETVGERNAEYDQFLEDIQKCGPGECRYGLFDFEYMHQCQGTSESSKKQKLFLMSWCPDTAKVKKKMLYSSSFDALKKSLVGVQKYIQATDLSEASREAVEEKLRATDRQ